MAVDPLGGVLGVLGLVGTALDILQLGFIVADRNENVSVLRGQLHLEALVLRRWAECVLIGAPGEVPVISGEDLKIIRERMNSMLQLFQEASELAVKHSGVLEPLFPLDAADDVQPPPTTVQSRLSATLSKAKIVSHTFKWAVRDFQRLQALVAHITTIREGLAALRPPDMHLMSLQILADVMPSTARDRMSTIDTAARVTAENNPSDTPLMDPLRSALAIRALKPDAVPTIDEETVSQMDNLYIAKYTVDTPEGALPPSLERCHVRMSSQQFSHRPVIIEWRLFNRALYRALALFEADVVKLCWLLHSLKSHPDVHLPRCLGYIRDVQQHSTRFGVVLEFPATVQIQSRMAQGRPQSLYDAINDRSYRPPAVEIRLQVAMNIAASVFQLLSVGWLHKALRSDNLLLVNGFTVRDLGDENNSSPQRPGSVDFMLGGFEFARLDKPGEISRSATDSSDEQDLYRHPDAVSGKWASVEYTQHGYLKVYDIYALGVLLAELGFWRTMADLKRAQTTRQVWQAWRQVSFPEYLRHRVETDMPGVMGTRFARVVEWCLGNTALLIENRVLQQFEEHVLVHLALCRQAASVL